MRDLELPPLDPRLARDDHLTIAHSAALRAGDVHVAGGLEEAVDVGWEGQGREIGEVEVRGAARQRRFRERAGVGESGMWDFVGDYGGPVLSEVLWGAGGEVHDAVDDTVLEGAFLIDADWLALEGGGVLEEGVWARFEVLEPAVLDQVEDLER